MSIFLSYILLGLSLAAPIGPINAAQLDRGIRYGFFHAWFVGIGATLADAIYMLFVFVGMVHFLQYEIVQTFLWLFVFFILVYTGCESLLGINQLSVDSRFLRSSESLMKSFSTGFIMSLFNPLTILFWLGIFGSVIANTFTSYGLSKVLLYSCAIFIGIISWDVTMAAFSSTLRHFLTNRLLKAISFLSGLSLIGFGIYFGYKALIVLFS